jgi:hypothetical protein
MMKKALYLLPLLLLPVLLVAGVFPGMGFKHPGIVMPHSVSYRMQNQIVSSYDGENVIPETRANMHYNLNHPTRIDSMTLDMFDSETGKWSDTIMAAVYTYNAAGMVESSSMYAIYGGVQYFGFEHTAEYDSQNRLIRFFAYSSEYDEFRDMVPESRMHIVYGEGTTFEIFNWDTYDDDPYSHETFQFDTQGRIIEQYGYSSADSANWVQTEKIETTYHPQDTLTGAEFISYIAHNLPVMFITEYFGLPGKMLSETAYRWESEAWLPESRTLYSYDDQIRKISSIEQYPNDADWLPDTRDLFYYDANGNAESVISQIYLGEDDYMNSERIDYTWETYTANSDLIQGPVSELRLKAYPVPFAGIVNILAESKSSAPLAIGIYNQRGQLVRKLSGLAGSNLAWDGQDQSGKACSSGIYFLRANQGLSTATAKIVKLQ